MKTLIALIIISASCFGQSKLDSVLFLTPDTIHSKIVYEGDYRLFNSKSNPTYYHEIITTGYIHYRADTAYMISVIEDGARFDFVKDSGKWVLSSQRIEFSEGIYPYYIDRCQALTGKYTRCKRKGNPFCWQHK